MRDLSRRARVYLGASYLLGLVAMIGLFSDTSQNYPIASSWELAAVLIVLTSISQAFVVIRSMNNDADYLTPAPLFAALLLLPSPLLLLVVTVSFVPEWFWFRRSWFSQAFSIASWLVALGAGHAVLVLFAGNAHLTREAPMSAAVVAAVLLVVLATRTALHVGLLGVIQGRSPKQMSLLAPAKLFAEASLLCAGWALAASWLLNPLYGLAAVAPFVLIFQGLQVPSLRDEASTDPKTGLANVRHFSQTFERGLQRARRNGHPVSLLLCDLDLLRAVNNTYGHQAGDVVLRGIADIIRTSIRGGDLAGRFGGEEFCVFLSDTDSAGARRAAERIRRLVEVTRFPIDWDSRSIQATLSIGVASCPRDGQTAELLMREADLAVYTAKREGRNRVMLAGSETREMASDWARDDGEGSPGRMSSILNRFRRYRVDPPRVAPPPADSPLTPSPPSGPRVIPHRGIRFGEKG
jgi:diguanylate cyclase (GGDEF)-like protein